MLAIPELAGAVPTRQTVGDILNRLGHKLRRVRKARPKKRPQTDAIFAHVHDTRRESAADPDTLKISIDT